MTKLGLLCPTAGNDVIFLLAVSVLIEYETEFLLSLVKILLDKLSLALTQDPCPYFLAKLLKVMYAGTVTDISRISTFIQELPEFFFPDLLTSQSDTLHAYFHCHPAQFALIMPEDFSMSTFSLFEVPYDGSAVIGIADMKEAIESGGMKGNGDFALRDEEDRGR